MQNPAQHNYSVGILCMLGAGVSFTLMQAMAKSLSGELPPLETGFFRCLATALLVTPSIIRGGIRFLGNNHRLIFIRGFAGATSLGLGFIAVSGIPLGEASTLWKTSVIFTALFSVIFLKERMTFFLALCITMAFLGAALILKPGTGGFNVYGLSGLAAGIAVGIVAVSIRHLHNSEHYLSIVFGFGMYGALFLAPFAFAAWVTPSPLAMLTLGGIGVSGTIGQLFYTKAFLHAPASIVQPYSFSEVLLAALLGALWWGEIPDILTCIGGVFIVLAGIGILRMNRAAQRSALKPPTQGG